MRLQEADGDFEILGEYEGRMGHVVLRRRGEEDVVGYDVAVDHQLIDLLRPRFRLEQRHGTSFS